MATESVRNLLNNKVSSVIARSKQQIKDEGKKQVLKLKQQIPSPQELVDNLKTTPSNASCTGKGKEQFDKKHQEMLDKIDKLQQAVGKSLSKMEDIESKLKGLVNPGGVLDTINNLANTLNPIISTLNIIVLSADILVKIVGNIPLPPNGAGVPPGPIVTGNEAAKTAKGIVTELSMLILSLTLIVGIYTRKINKIIDMLSLAVSRLAMLKDQLDKLVVQAQFMKLEFEEACDGLLNSENGATFAGSGGQGGSGSNLINGNNIGSLADGMSLEDLIAHTEMLYGQVLNGLKAQGDKRALEKVSRLEKETKEFVVKYNISFKIINI